MTFLSAELATQLVASFLFILSLAGLSQHETAKRGLNFGIVGMALALGSTIWLIVDTDRDLGVILLVVAMAAGAVVGLWRARIVEMTGMPELIALLHSFVGLAAVLVGWNGHFQGVAEREHGVAPDQLVYLHIHDAEVFIGVFIGAVTFTGSIVAFLKLSARMKSAPMVLPGKNFMNVGALLQVAHDEWIIRVLATAAILLASINVFGGFAVTRRMLGMFSKGGH